MIRSAGVDRSNLRIGRSEGEPVGEKKGHVSNLTRLARASGCLSQGVGDVLRPDRGCAVAMVG